jgi:RNA 3'-terminal phosphate cyclase
VTSVTLPLLRRMGLGLDARVHRRGYFPQGGGQVEVSITPLQPGETLRPIELVDAGQPVRVLAFVSGVVNCGGAVERLVEGLLGPCVPKHSVIFIVRN